jgi:hypothetical protein
MVAAVLVTVSPPQVLVLVRLPCFILFFLACRRREYR